MKWVDSLGPAKRRIAAFAVVVLAITPFAMLGPSKPAFAVDFIINTYAGTGTAGFSGDAGAALQAQLNGPGQLALDSAGNLYISEWDNRRVRKVTPAGTITTVAGNGSDGWSGDGGLATAAPIGRVGGIAIDSNDNLYISSAEGHVVRKVDKDGVITKVAGIGGSASSSGDSGPATSAHLNKPNGIAFDQSGNIYIAEYSGARIRKINSSGIISTFAGTGTQGNTGNGGQATAARLAQPTSLVFDALGNLYIGQDTAGAGIRKVNTSGIISNFAGNGTAGYTGNGGQATSAGLSSVEAMVFDALGNMYLTDTWHYAVRKIDTNGIIETAFGAQGGGYSGDGGPAGEALMSAVDGLAIDAQGNIYVSDFDNHRVRVVSAMVPASQAQQFSVSVSPMLNFSVAGNSSACNGEADFVATAGDAAKVNLGHASPGTNVSGGQSLSVSSNAPNGFSVSISGLQTSQNLRSLVHNWVDVTGTYAAPAALGSGERFGYTFKDSTASHSTLNPLANTFIALDSTPRQVMGSTVSSNGSGCVSLDAQSTSTTPAGSYSATIIYNALPAY